MIKAGDENIISQAVDVGALVAPLSRCNDLRFVAKNRKFSCLGTTYISPKREAFAHRYL
jgi:hypothetical protein